MHQAGFRGLQLGFEIVGHELIGTLVVVRPRDPDRVIEPLHGRVRIRYLEEFGPKAERGADIARAGGQTEGLPEPVPAESTHELSPGKPEPHRESDHNQEDCRDQGVPDRGQGGAEEALYDGEIDAARVAHGRGDEEDDDCHSRDGEGAKGSCPHAFFFLSKVIKRSKMIRMMGGGGYTLRIVPAKGRYEWGRGMEELRSVTRAR